MLITTRDERLGKRLASRHASIVVSPMSPQEAKGLLENWGTEPHDGSNSDESRILLEALEYLPLAITQAAAFISENHITLKKYLEIFRTSDSDMQDLLDQDLGDLRRDSQSHNSVIKTWKLSFDLITKKWPRAAKMLSLMAFLDRQGIPEGLLRDDSDTNVNFTKALGTLLAFSLIKAGSSGAGYELHRLVQLATRKWLEIQGQTELWQGKALSVVANMFPNGIFENWTTCESLLPHARTVIPYGDTNGIHPEECSNLLFNVADFDREQGRYQTACVGYLAAIEIYKKVFGLEHPSTLSTMSNLALTYMRQGRWEEAEELYIQASETQRRVLGAEHSYTLVSMNNLAVTYEKQGRWDKAEKLQVQELETTKRVLGAEHPDTITSMYDLAWVYKGQDRYSEAISLMETVVDLRTKRLGANHPYTIESVEALKGWLDSWIPV